MKNQLIAFFLLFASSLFAQQPARNENTTMWWSINSYRQRYELSPIAYKFSAQSDCDDRAQQIESNFDIPQEGFEGICDGEQIFRNDTYIHLLEQMTDRSDMYFDKDVQYICVSVVKTDEYYYAVVRIWEHRQ